MYMQGEDEKVMERSKVVLAYSGGLDTSVAIKWLNERYGYDVIAVSLDVGEGKDLDFVKQKALQVGAVQSVVIDAKEVFAEQFLNAVLPQIAAFGDGRLPQHAGRWRHAL